MKYRKALGTISRLAIAVFTAAVGITACNSNGTPTEPQVPAGAVRLQGAFDNLVPAETIIEARAAAAQGSLGLDSAATNRGRGSLYNSRSLISQSASISAILSGVEVDDFDLPGVVTTTEVTEEGGFAIDVDTSADVVAERAGDYVMIAYDETLGVGVQQLLGFIEVPAGADESSAGWPLGGTAQGTTVDLGTMGGDGGTDRAFVAAAEQEGLYELLGADQAAILFEARRDNYLKVVANSLLNRDAELWYFGNLYITAKLNSAKDAWTPVATVTEPAGGAPDSYFGYFYGVNFDSDVYAWSDFEAGPNSFVLTPPADVVPQNSTDTFGPERPLGSDLFWPNGGEPDNDLINGVGFVGPPPEGIWTMEVNGELDGAYDLSFSSLFNQDDAFLYFLPSFRINTDDTDQIQSFELRFFVWDFDQQEYTDFPIQDVPVDFSVSYGANTEADPDGVGELLDFVDGVATPSFEIYWPTSDAGNRIWDLSMGYSIAGMSVDFIFQPDYDEL